VLEFYEFLRDALIDAEVAMRPQYWPDWMKPPRSCTVASGRASMTSVAAMSSRVHTSRSTAPRLSSRTAIGAAMGCGHEAGVTFSQKCLSFYSLP
jgi:hypothetical protein